jgi:hypothetical protein
MDLGPKAEMREIRTSGLMSGIWKRDRLGHRARSRLYQIFRFVKSPPVAGRLGSGLPGRKLSRLTPTDAGTLCAFPMGA